MDLRKEGNEEFLYLAPTGHAQGLQDRLEGQRRPGPGLPQGGEEQEGRALLQPAPTPTSPRSPPSAPTATSTSPTATGPATSTATTPRASTSRPSAARATPTTRPPARTASTPTRATRISRCSSWPTASTTGCNTSRSTASSTTWWWTRRRSSSRQGRQRQAPPAVRLQPARHGVGHPRPARPGDDPGQGQQRRRPARRQPQRRPARQQRREAGRHPPRRLLLPARRDVGLARQHLRRRSGCPTAGSPSSADWRK